MKEDIRVGAHPHTSGMEVVDVSETNTKHEAQGEKKRFTSICVCVRFDANPLTSADTVFRGVRSFHSLSEVVVPLKGMSLEETTLGDLLTEFMSRARRRFPCLSQFTVDAFYLNLEGLPMSVNRLLEDPPLVRLDVNVNGQDSLDNFFAPSPTIGPTVYEITAHWIPKLELVRSSERNATEVALIAQGDAQKEKNKKGVKNVEEQECKETESGGGYGDFSGESLPAPVIYPFTQRCTYAMLWSHRSDSKSNSIASEELATSPTATLTVTLTQKKVACNERRKFEADERDSRRLLMKGEQEARRTIEELKNEEKGQIIRLLRLMPDDLLHCDSISVDIPKSWYSIPVDTEPLFNPPSAAFKQELAKRVEETAWLSHVFASNPIAGSALGVAKESRRKNQNGVGTGTSAYSTAPAPAAAVTGGSVRVVSGRADSTSVNKAEGYDEIVDGYSTTMEDLVQHYADVRRDLLLWERQEFRALKAEMLHILEKQRRLDEEILRAAFHEEFEEEGVFDFNNYANYYEQLHAFTQEERAPGSKPNDTFQSKMTDQGEMTPTKVRTSGLYAGQGLTGNDFNTEVGSVATGQTVTPVVPSITLPPLPPPRSPRSCSTDDEKFHQALDKSRARVKDILNTIALIDMRWQEPVSAKLVKNRIMLAEVDERKAFLEEENEKRSDMLMCAKQEALDIERNEFLAYCRLIDPFVNEEREVRNALEEEQESHMALLSSLHRRGIEQIKVVLGQRQ